MAKYEALGSRGRHGAQNQTKSYPNRKMSLCCGLLHACAACVDRPQEVPQLPEDWKSIDCSTSAIPGSFGWLRGRFGGAKVLYCLHLRRKISIQYSTFVVRRRKSAVLSAFEAQKCCTVCISGAKLLACTALWAPGLTTG